MNINTEILQLNVDVGKINEVINNRMFDFITKANELVELSNDDYQIEKTLELNKISLKGYVLESDCCSTLCDNNVKNYSIAELKIYLTQFEKQFNEDCFKYYLSLSLYELIEDIEQQVDKKINLEINELSNIISKIDNIKSINDEEYEKFYYNIKNQLDNYLKDNRLDDKSYDICIQILNDIFNFYISGYPNIPDEYLYHDES